MICLLANKVRMRPTARLKLRLGTICKFLEIFPVIIGCICYIGGSLVGVKCYAYNAVVFLIISYPRASAHVRRVWVEYRARAKAGCAQAKPDSCVESRILICNLIAIGSRDFRVHDFSTDHELHMVWHIGAVYMSRASPAKRADSILSRLVVA